MKIDEAIEILTELNGLREKFAPDGRKEALMLGIEALKRARDNRKVPYHYTYISLPGEDR